jgi:hypothetical protein
MQRGLRNAHFRVKNDLVDAERIVRSPQLPALRFVRGPIPSAY